MTGTAAGPRRWIHRALLLLLILLVLEGLSWVTLARFLAESDFIRRDLDRFPDSVTLDQMVAARDRSYDPSLGWVPRPGYRGSSLDSRGDPWTFSIDETGARTNPYASDRVEVSVYGDSFAFCTDVDDDESWPYLLSRLTDTRVLNFGVPAYGPDQALWRLQTLFPEHPTRIVVLSILSENIGRLLMSYRPFFFTRTKAVLGFKPILELEDGAWRKGPHPLPRAESLEDLREALARLRRSDYWYLRNEEKPRVAFPYLLSLLEVATFRFGAYEEPNLYELPEATDRLRAVVHQFVETGRREGFTPLVLFIPRANDLRAHVEGKKPPYRGFVAALRGEPALEGVRILDLLDHPFDARRFNVKPLSGHASAYGNEIIAGVVFDALREDLELLEGEPPLAGTGP